MYRAYGKIKKSDGTYNTSHTVSGERFEVIFAVKAWFFDNAYDSSTPYAIYRKREGGSYKLFSSTGDAETELYAQTMAQINTVIPSLIRTNGEPP